MKKVVGRRFYSVIGWNKFAGRVPQDVSCTFMITIIRVLIGNSLVLSLG